VQVIGELSALGERPSDLSDREMAVAQASLAGFKAGVPRVSILAMPPIEEWRLSCAPKMCSDPTRGLRCGFVNGLSS